ncbi:hypothetical protein [Candidatus Trichorickettsia mobilis]|uniref:hypothetical protein n=1 Tax=Candidatus Trichorickettsia mobilis TaxID=1346319 RepID=UPI0029305D7F|nr:hypothetical protein [Candidatus Trichorickettsia mobilis]
MKYGQKQWSFWGWLASSIDVCCDCDGRKSEWESYKQEISRSEMNLGDQNATLWYSSTSASAPVLAKLEQEVVNVANMRKAASFNPDDPQTYTTTDTEIVGASAISTDDISNDNS